MAAGILGSAIPAAADTWKADALLAQLAQASWKVGPFRIQPRLMLSDFGYDSNIYHRPDEVSDFTLTAGPQLTAFLSLKRKVILSFSESPRYVYYFDTVQQRGWNNYFTGQASFLLNNVFFQISGYSNNARQRWSYEVDTRPRLMDTGYGSSLLWQPSQRTSLSVSFRQGHYRYEVTSGDSEDIAGRLNRDETFMNVIIYRQATTRARAFIDFEYGRADFQLPSNPRDALSYAGYGGLEFSDKSRIRGRIRIGYKLFHPLSADYTDYKGLVGDTSVSVTVMRPLVLRGVYRRNIQFSRWRDTPFYLMDSSGAGLSLYILRRRFRLDYDYSQIWYDYPDLSSAGSETGSPATVRHDSIYTNTAGLFFRIVGDIGIGFRAGRYNRRVTVNDWNIDRNFYTLSLTYEF